MDVRWQALDDVESRLESLGYEAKGDFGIPGQRYFRKDSPTGIRTHHLHAFTVGAANIERHLNWFGRRSGVERDLINPARRGAQRRIN